MHYADEFMEVGDTRTSPGGACTLLPQEDGNIVIYVQDLAGPVVDGTRGKWELIGVPRL